MRILLAAIAASVLGGCVLYTPHGVRSSGLAAQKCPPGHTWSDGTCHDTGKGHDPAKHAR